MWQIDGEKETCGTKGGLVSGWNKRTNSPCMKSVSTWLSQPRGVYSRCGLFTWYEHFIEHYRSLWVTTGYKVFDKWPILWFHSDRESHRHYESKKYCGLLYYMHRRRELSTRSLLWSHENISMAISIILYWQMQMMRRIFCSSMSLWLILRLWMILDYN